MVAKELENEVNKQLTDLLNKDSTLESLKSIMSDKNTADRLRRARDFLKQNQEIFFILRKCVAGNKRFETFIDALFYVFQFEVSTNLNVDYFVFLLMQTTQNFNIDYYNRKKQIAIQSIDELVEVPLGTKLDYLASKKSKLDCFRTYANTTIRNKIAHMDFKIDEEGQFFTYDMSKGFQEVNLSEALDNVAYLNSLAMHSIAGTRKAVLNKK